jgi:hypothetical protein
MKTILLKDIFNIEYGNQLDLNKLVIDKENGVNFISRSKKNLGVQTKVRKISNKTLFKKGSITVTLGGSYLLSAFVQQNSFYTGQNIKVLTPKIKLTDLEKKFYCYVISHNRFRYTSHGREANKTLDYLPVPTKENIPKWVYTTKIPKIIKKPLINNEYNLNIKTWQYFKLGNIFNISKGKTPKNQIEGNTRLISATNSNNGLSKKISSLSNKNKANTITVSSNGSIAESFYQDKDFFATGDINILECKNINVYVALFINTIISKEKFRFNYGRKWGKEKMIEHKIKLPTIGNQPDWKFMEDYVKSLNYSASLDSLYNPS